jgi:hypothetical protein
MMRKTKRSKGSDKKTLNFKEWMEARDRLASLSARVESFRKSKESEIHETADAAQHSEGVR